MKELFHHFSSWLMLPQFFKKGLKNSKDDYRPISILKNLSKILKKLCINRWLSSWINTLPNFNMALSKAFDCLPHELLLAKLNAYGFSLSALRHVLNYLFNSQQKSKINESYSSREETF